MGQGPLQAIGLECAELKKWFEKWRENRTGMKAMSPYIVENGRE